MPHKPILNPYTSTIPPADTTKGAAKLGLRDKHWFNSRFPFAGSDDKIISTLYSYFIQHLRTAINEYDSSNPDASPSDHAWEPNHPYWDVLRSVLQRFALGLPSGVTGSRDDGRRTDGVHQKDGGAEKLRPNPQGESTQRGGSGLTTKEKVNQILSGLGDGTADADKGGKTVEDLLKQVEDISLYGVSD